jgi:hypothetical protein
MAEADSKDFLNRLCNSVKPIACLDRVSSLRAKSLSGLLSIEGDWTAGKRIGGSNLPSGR